MLLYKKHVLLYKIECVLYKNMFLCKNECAYDKKTNVFIQKCNKH